MTEPNGFYYMRARYYDPEVGRFISEDPIGFEGGDVNLCAYVKNNPILLIDPEGLEDRIIGTRGGQPMVYNTETRQYTLGYPDSYVDPFTDYTRNTLNTTGRVIDVALNNPATEVLDAIPPGTSTGNPTVDILINALQIVKEGWNRLKNACQ
jgi:RHS repeat-associated protein